MSRYGSRNKMNHRLRHRPEAVGRELEDWLETARKTDERRANLGVLTVDDLRSLASDLFIPHTSRMTKAVLIDALMMYA